MADNNETKMMSIDELKQFCEEMREKIQEQQRQLESIPFVKAVRDGQVSIPLEVQLLAHALYYIDTEAANILSKKLIDTKAGVSELPKRPPSRAIKKLRG